MQSDQGGSSGINSESEPTANPAESKSFRPPACLVKSTAIAVVALAGGIFLIARGGQTGPLARTAAVLLIFIGAIASLPALLLGFGAYIQYIFKRKIASSLEGMKDVIDPARRSIEYNKQLYVEQYDYRDATDTDFAPLDRAWYDARTAELEAAGFRRLGPDIVNATIEKAANVAPVIRRHVSADGTTMVGTYHLFLPPKLPGRPEPKHLRTIDVETEFTDGSFLVTANTLESDLTTPPPAFHKKRYTRDTPLPDLLRLHEAEKSALLATKPGESALVITTVDEALASQRRAQVIKSAHQKGLGYLDPQTVRRVAEQKNTDESNKALAVAAAELARREELTRQRETP